MPIGHSSPPSSPSDVKVLSEGTGTTTAALSVQNLADVTLPTDLGNDELYFSVSFMQVSGVGSNTSFGWSNAVGDAAAVPWAVAATQSDVLIIRAKKACDDASKVSMRYDNATSTGFNANDTEFVLNAAEHFYLNVGGKAAQTYTVRWIVYRVGSDVK